MRVLGLIALVFAPVSCSAGGDAPSVAGSAGSSSVGSASGANGTGAGTGSGTATGSAGSFSLVNAAHAKSGTRIKVRGYSSDDGAELGTTFFDSELGLSCYSQSTIAGIKCVPYQEMQLFYYSDSYCTVPIARVPDSLCGTVAYGYTYANKSDCSVGWQAPVISKLYSSRNNYSGPVYSKSTTCVALTSEQATLAGYHFVTVAEEPLTLLATLKVHEF